MHRIDYLEQLELGELYMIISKFQHATFKQILIRPSDSTVFSFIQYKAPNNKVVLNYQWLKFQFAKNFVLVVDISAKISNTQT